MHDDGPLVLRADATVRDLMITAGGTRWVDALAHDNADSGFELTGKAELSACASYANGEPDEVGVQEGAPVPADLPPAAVRIGRSKSAVRRFEEAVDELEGALNVVDELIGERFGATGHAAKAERLIRELAKRVETLRDLG